MKFGDTADWKSALRAEYASNENVRSQRKLSWIALQINANFADDRFANKFAIEAREQNGFVSVSISVHLRSNLLVQVSFIFRQQSSLRLAEE